MLPLDNSGNGWSRLIICSPWMTLSLSLSLYLRPPYQLETKRQQYWLQNALRTHTHTHSHTNTLMNVYIYRHTYTNMQTHTKRVHTPTRTYIYTLTLAPTHWLHNALRAHTLAHKHTHTQTQSEYTHTHTYTKAVQMQKRGIHISITSCSGVGNPCVFRHFMHYICVHMALNQTDE